jgi:hypothetical protein
VLERPLDGATAVLARNVIALRAQYGAVVAAGARRWRTWEDATGTFATLDATSIARCVRCVSAWSRAARSARRPTPEGVCEASLAKPQLFGAEIEPDVSDWQCYRFRSAVVVIPLRNLVLGIKT